MPEGKGGGGWEPDQLTSLTVKVDALRDEIRRLETMIEKLEETQSVEFLTRTEFDADFKPVRVIVYGMVGTICLGFLGWLMTLVGLTKAMSK